MLNLDKIMEKKNELLNSMAEAMREQDENKLKEAFEGYGNFLSERIQEEAAGILSATDAAILGSRGTRQLTSAENSYYEKLIAASKGPNPQNAVVNIDRALPETVIDSVLDDIATNHPLLSAVHFINTTALTKIITNKQGVQQAAWGELSSAIVQELAGSIGVESTTLCKLTAFMYIANDMLELGPQWVDAYMRSTLSEAVAVALEIAIVDGDGKNKPIGMCRALSGASDGVYPRKSAVKLTEITPTSYGEILAKLATDSLGRARAVQNVIMCVNPADYFTKIMPATTMLLLDGRYAHDVLPYPTTIIQSVGVPSGHVVIGMGSAYDMYLGGAKNGKIELDSSYKFLEDVTTYKIKLYGNGKAKDENAFVLADISELAPSYPVVNSIDITPAAVGG